MAKTTRRARFISGVAVLSLLSLAAACGDDPDDTSADDTSADDTSADDTTEASGSSDPAPDASSSTAGTSPTTVDDATTTSPAEGTDATTGSPDATGSSGATEGAVAGDTGAFPRTVEHALGSTEIPAAPQRVVTLDM